MFVLSSSFSFFFFGEAAPNTDLLLAADLADFPPRDFVSASAPPPKAAVVFA